MPGLSPPAARTPATPIASRSCTSWSFVHPLKRRPAPPVPSEVEGPPTAPRGSADFARVSGSVTAGAATSRSPTFQATRAATRGRGTLGRTRIRTAAWRRRRRTARRSRAPCSRPGSIGSPRRSGVADVYRAHACTEREALERLAAEADLGTDRLSRIRVDFDPGIHRRITLWIPDLVGRPQPPESAVGLDQAIARVLVNAAAATDPRHAADPGAERLFISASVSPKAVVTLLRRLERFSTPARVARMQSEAGGDVWLLHVLVDRARHSGFAGLEAIGLLESWEPLSGYESEGCRLFLDADVPLSRDLLPPLWRLMSNDDAASLLALTPQGPRDERFYILRRMERASAASDDFERIALPERAFVDSLEVGFVPAASVRTSTLSAGAGASNLASSLREDAPARGFRLTLESTRAIEEAGRDLDRLRSQQAYLSQRVAYAESLQRPRPRLLRFTSGQLRALAHTIYSFDPDSLFRARPHVRYAFRATPDDPAGRHYLWIDPEAMRRTPDPLALYEAASPIRFWLDPTWGRHYQRDGGAGSVFVPENTGLAPPLHAWIPGDIDAHLRRVFGSLSDSHIYVVDRAADGPDALELTLFERDAFKAIDTCVSWLNDHITVAERVDVTTAVRDTAAAARGELLSDRAVADAAAGGRDFQREAALTRQRFMKDLDAVISSINRCTFEVLQRAHLAIDGMKRLDADLHVLADIRERSAGIAS